MDIELSSETNGLLLAYKITERFNLTIIFLAGFEDEKKIAEIEKACEYSYIVNPFTIRS